MAANRERGVVVPLPSRTRRERASGRSDEAEVYAFTGPSGAAVLPAPTGWDDRAATALAFVRARLAGAYEVDEYGFDAGLTDAVTLPLLDEIFRRWLHTEVNGLEHVPSAGPALLVANHVGGLTAWDVPMTVVAVRTQHPARRLVRVLADELVFRAPGLGVLARRSGATFACAADAERLLRAGELVGAWPEGVRGLRKPFRDRHRVSRFGHAAFAACAVAAGAPIVPVSIVTADRWPSSRLPGALGLVPRPAAWYVEFGPPLSTTGYDPHDPDGIGRLADEVHDAIESSLVRLLAQRRTHRR